ncbi:MAG: hypothetical protein ACYSWW_20805 [Planctomycetota bacterium]|jgi:chromosome segregation ATPase
MTFDGVMEKVKAILILLYERPWERWELLIIAAGLFVFLLLLVARRRRKARGRIVYAGHVPEVTTVIGTKLADTNQSGKRLKKSRKSSPVHARRTQENRRKWSTAAERRKGSDDPARQLQLRCEITKHNQTKARLEREVAELKVTGEQVRQESAQNKQVKERLKQQAAEVTVAEEQLQIELAESKRAEEKLKRKVAELKVANEQLRQEAAEYQKAGRSGRDSRYEDYHRVVDGAEQKLCRKCNEWKARSEYHKNASSKDGLATWCKLCKTKAARESRQRRTAPKD